mmetsp:Transcript_7807/g.23888  ORF Transcript_7807/g.23888 Transcript_7807/m.23888 type:complete len:591 (-) Transcript_7807:559-2331(-)
MTDVRDVGVEEDVRAAAVRRVQSVGREVGRGRAEDAVGRVVEDDVHDDVHDPGHARDADGEQRGVLPHFVPRDLEEQGDADERQCLAPQVPAAVPRREERPRDFLEEERPETKPEKRVDEPAVQDGVLRLEAFRPPCVDVGILDQRPQGHLVEEDEDDHAFLASSERDSAILAVANAVAECRGEEERRDAHGWAAQAEEGRNEARDDDDELDDERDAVPFGAAVAVHVVEHLKRADAFPPADEQDRLVPVRHHHARDHPRLDVVAYSLRFLELSRGERGDPERVDAHFGEIRRPLLGQVLVDVVVPGLGRRGSQGVPVDDLRRRRLVGRVALWGRSMGAATSLLYAATRDPDAAAVVADSPYSSLVDLCRELVAKARRRSRAPGQAASASASAQPADAKTGTGARELVLSAITEAALALVRASVKHRAGFDIFDVSPIAHVANMRHSATPVLFVHGAKDDFVAPTHSMALNDAHGGDATLLLVPCDHQAQRPASAMLDALLFVYDRLAPASSDRAKYATLLAALADDGYLGTRDKAFGPASSAQANNHKKAQRLPDEDAASGLDRARQRRVERNVANNLHTTLRLAKPAR